MHWSHFDRDDLLDERGNGRGDDENEASNRDQMAALLATIRIILVYSGYTYRGMNRNSTIKAPNAPRLAASNKAKSLSLFPSLNHDHFNCESASVMGNAMAAFMIVTSTEISALSVIPYGQSGVDWPSNTYSTTIIPTSAPMASTQLLISHDHPAPQNPDDWARTKACSLGVNGVEGRGEPGALSGGSSTLR